MAGEDDTDETCAAEAIRKRLSEWTVRLVGFDAQNHPIAGSGSGLLWHRGDKLTLLSVYHNFRKVHRFIDTGIRHGDGTCLIPIGEPGSMDESTLVGERISEPRDTDFAWAHIDLDALKRSMPATLKGATVPVYRGTFEPPPSGDRAYGFAAWIGDWFHPRSQELGLRLAFELYMKFDGTQQDGEFAGFDRFLLARDHQGHDYYYGASGAPIADEQCQIVALVAGGDRTAGVIYGCPLQEFSRYVDL